jgi:hypothetical protein
VPSSSEVKEKHCSADLCCVLFEVTVAWLSGDGCCCRNDVFPCRVYLRHCTLAAKNLSSLAYTSFLDDTYLADRCVLHTSSSVALIMQCCELFLFSLVPTHLDVRIIAGILESNVEVGALLLQTDYHKATFRGESGNTGGAAPSTTC